MDSSTKTDPNTLVKMDIFTILTLALIALAISLKAFARLPIDIWMIIKFMDVE
jgi:hypothetical protein